MKNIGEKIKSIRISKGISQEELADKSNVNIRTIQRIESNQNTPHGKTMQLICESLGIQPEDVLDYTQQEDTTILMWLYLSVLSYFILPLGNIIVPLIIWLTNKSHVQNCDKLGRNIVYNQIIISVLGYLFLIGFALIKINHYSGIPSYVLLVGFLLVSTYNVVYAIYGAIMIKSKNQIIWYPLFK